MLRLCLAVVALMPAAALAQNHIAPTEAKTAAEELKTFTVPAGFAVQLVAAEPDIGKPIQIAFDSKNRLWATTSRHYPFAAAAGEKPSDKLFVLSDFGADGKAKSVVLFADDLNIPIGILPLPDGKSCLVSEVGRIVKKSDTDGDGKADKTEALLTGFGTRDTHGMMNSFLLMPDGWVYACHGFSNESKVVGIDGSTIAMQSGNTFRFKPDGTKVEHWTFGQVNPFGLTFDPNFNLYTADCHSKPITQLIRGSCYDSFGKPHDGLGYGPHVTRHDHGSTALCGLSWYQAGYYPKEYSGCMFLGNVVTNRINADRIVFKGSTPVAVELPDLVKSSDPWFRPTDVKLSPDGALYFADFYNRIIGHYEVDLKHPQRDKDRGRIWRVVRTDSAPKAPFADLNTTDRTLLASLLQHDNLIVRTMAANELIRRDKIEPRPKSMVDELSEMLREGGTPAKAAGIRTAVERVIGEPNKEFLPALLAIAERAPADDTHMIHAARIALRNCLQAPSGLESAIQLKDLSDKAQTLLVGVIVALPDARAAKYLAGRFAGGDRNADYCGTIGRYGDDDDCSRVIGALTDPREAAAKVLPLLRGVQARGGALPAASLKRIERDCETAIVAADPATVTAGITLASTLKLAPIFPTLVKFAADSKTTEDARRQAYEALVQIDAGKASPILAAVVRDAGKPQRERDRTAVLLGAAGTVAGRTELLTVLLTAPTKFAGTLALGLAQTPAGSQALLEAVEAGKASPRLLQDRAVAAKLLTHDRGKFRPTIDGLTKSLPNPSAAMGTLLKDRAAGYAKATPDAARGKIVYAAQCANCHRVGDVGGKIGPQLDGIGNRGLERLLEDTLNPSLNVDAEFRAAVITTVDGRTFSGLVLREEGAVLVMSDNVGKEIRIPKADIESRTISPLSPMPANIDTLIKPEEYYDLLAYLLSLSATK